MSRLLQERHSLSGKTNWHWLCLRVRRYWLLPKFRLEKQYRTPLIMWQRGYCSPLGQQIESLLSSAASKLNVVDRVSSFELMAVLVASGYGIGLATKSRISCSRNLDLVMRPLANGSHQVTTYLALPHSPMPATVKRLIQRAQAVANNDSL
ncbi:MULTISPECIES: LysR substrate-binding domain-containing protein [Pseudomonas]|uniref:LysR substrate-binding domain-containing protein n=1 Tax=Pseudomonas TaxID=286 RepID=UPI0018AAD9D2|nr:MULTISPECIES: LysR substrate-binding domain-containing protein [Pseudomonas]MBF8677651.1 hypothetical protein [Pseudomonas fulva]MBF8719821.1 hypothetical protein [Pseudomonas fulva]MBF8767754.1 hypothetical protein [Pseudomonas putida]MBF8786028.1 hypothetical protein [Pseudomonas fulva]MBH3346226.1 hypothetical protein [Pseudomonas parafulva]